MSRTMRLSPWRSWPCSCSWPAAPANRPAKAVPPLAQTWTETDGAALAARYNATDGPNRGQDESWLSDAPIGGWYGVATDGNDSMTEPNLQGNR